MSDQYKTLLKPSLEILFKERNSKFYGYAFPIKDEMQAKEYIDALHKANSKANHVCYAWQLGIENPTFRVNDDGEPSNSAGNPIYGQIQSFEITNVLIAVVRYFGGTKLGVGGLIHAYRTAAQLALQNSIIVERIQEESFSISFKYAAMNRVMRIIKKRQLRIVSQTTDLECTFVIAVRKKHSEEVKSIFKNAPNITLND
jgi:uncharacterized YigZ family protein